MLLLPLHLLF